jgi:hypothetical protein
MKVDGVPAPAVGASLQEVKDLLGHRSLAMTLRYGHLAPEHLRSAVARLDTTLPASDSAQETGSRSRCSRSSCRCWCAWQESNLRPSD